MSSGDVSPQAVPVEPTRPTPRLFERIRSLLGLDAPSARDDIEEAIAESTETGELSTQEQSMLKNVLGLHEIRVGDIMVPRADVVAAPIDATLGDVLALFRTAGHSRLPVHGATLDDPRGMLHIRDFVDYLAGAALGRRLQREQRREGVAPQRLVGALDLSTPLESANILRPVLFVPPSMPALDLLVKMQATRTHMALVIDEYGGTDGLVSMEDIVEVIVGDIEDEHDEAEGPAIEKTGEDVFVADARASLEEVAAALGVERDALAGGEGVDTLGGLIAALAGRVPARGETVTSEAGLVFEVLDADPRRVKRLRIRRRPAADPALSDKADETG
ncbi:MAG: HlyC/CorC family transporter [Methylobacteriaceae bacterium]|nr:HlyC/CorC family transporter [Methylobacteriaceae bacterium]